MKLLTIFSIFVMLFNTFPLHSETDKFKFDSFKTKNGTLKIYFIGHGTLMLNYNNLIIHIDPVSSYADYSKMPKADIILITHQHSDHLDKNAIANITKKNTALILNQSSFDILKQGFVMKNGDKKVELDIIIEAIPAYNTTKNRDRFHPKGRDNGYLLTLDDKNIYIAGDTEDIPEIGTLKNIDIAFLPMNQPYTMTQEQIVHALKIIKPKIFYPYHYTNTDVNILINLMKNIQFTELRIRELK